MVSNRGKVKNLKTGHLMTEWTNSRGYKLVTLSRKTDEKNEIKKKFVHQLVALAFIPVYSFERNRVNHIDGDKGNNEAYNLEWCTNKENSDHYKRKLRKEISFGDDHHTSKLRVHQVQEIRSLYDQAKMTQKELAEKFNVSQSAISQIVNIKIRKREKLENKKLFNYHKEE